MSESPEQWAKKILAADRRALGRAISAVERGDDSGVALLKILFPNTGNAFVVGVTGAPGAGKSTLLEKLALAYRAEGRRVGIVAVDPTSPFSGGAILGDRIRMQALSTDTGVYIRSMATRGQLGGLASAAYDAVTILDAAGCAVIFVETVGVGQDEVDVVRLADATVVLLAPGMGDDVQTFKAGVMEIADVFAVNKSDQPGADRVEQQINAMLSIAPSRDGWTPPIVRTIATTSQGVTELRGALERFREYSQSRPISKARRRQQVRVRLMELIRRRLFKNVWGAGGLDSPSFETQVDEILARRRDPHSVVEEIISAAGGVARPR